MLASFRMYNAVPSAAQAWRALFERVFADTDHPVRIVDHRWPDPIASLWQDPELCCAFMCGWPFARSDPSMRAIAAPVPSPSRYEGLPRYCSEFVVRESSGWRSLEDTFGSRFGWMARDSQSGFNAPRAFLARLATPQRPALYRETRGPLGTPATTLDALRADEVDVVALDCFWLDLCRRHAPERVDGLRCVATTPWTPIPLLVAAPGVDQAVVDALRRHLTALHTKPAYAPLLADVLLAKFVAPDVTAYRGLDALADYAVARDYETIR
jgi:ABC-type phosphate/phosphonate transport system substrate-binding protein